MSKGGVAHALACACQTTPRSFPLDSDASPTLRCPRCPCRCARRDAVARCRSRAPFRPGCANDAISASRPFRSDHQHSYEVTIDSETTAARTLDVAMHFTRGRARGRSCWRFPRGVPGTTCSSGSRGACRTSRRRLDGDAALPVASNSDFPDLGSSKGLKAGANVTVDFKYLADTIDRAVAWTRSGLRVLQRHERVHVSGGARLRLAGARTTIHTPIRVEHRNRDARSDRGCGGWRVLRRSAAHIRSRRTTTISWTCRSSSGGSISTACR